MKKLQNLNTYKHKKEFLQMTNMATDYYAFLVMGNKSSQNRRSETNSAHWHCCVNATNTKVSGIWILNASAFWHWILSGYMAIYSRNNPVSPLSLLCRHEKERKCLSSLTVQLLVWTGWIEQFWENCYIYSWLQNKKLFVLSLII